MHASKLNNSVGFAGAKVAEFFGSDMKIALSAFEMQMDAADKKADDAFSEDTFLQGVSEKLFQMRDAAEVGLGAIKEGAENVIDPINAVTTATNKLKDAQVAMAESGLKLGEDLIVQMAGDNELRLEILAERNAIELEQLKEANDQKLLGDEQYLLAVSELQNKHDQVETDRKKRVDRAELQRSQNRLRAASIFFGGFSALAAQGGKQSFMLSKRLAQAQAITDGIAAVQRAMANPPGPPFNTAIVAGTVAMTTANVARIEAQQLQDGIDSVPGIGSADNFPALLAPRERVVPAETNRDLKDFLSQQTDAITEPKVINENHFNFGTIIGGGAEAGMMIIQMINAAIDENDARIAGQ